MRLRILAGRERHGGGVSGGRANQSRLREIIVWRAGIDGRIGVRLEWFVDLDGGL